MEPPKRCEQAQGTAMRRGVNGASEHSEERTVFRRGMVARSTDGHKTNASLGAEHLDGDGVVMLYDNGHQRGHLQALFCDFL